MARIGPVFFDTSVLIAGTIDFGEASKASQHLMTEIADGRLGPVHTAWHCCLEFYAVATRLPEEFRLNPADCLRLLEGEILDRFHVHQLPAKSRRTFFHEAVRERTAGGRIYDAHIAEIARHSGAAVVVTENVRHFESLGRHDIRVVPAAKFTQR